MFTISKKTQMSLNALGEALRDSVPTMKTGLATLMLLTFMEQIMQVTALRMVRTFDGKCSQGDFGIYMGDDRSNIPTALDRGVICEAIVASKGADTFRVGDIWFVRPEGFSEVYQQGCDDGADGNCPVMRQ